MGRIERVTSMEGKMKNRAERLHSCILNSVTVTWLVGRYLLLHTFFP